MRQRPAWPSPRGPKPRRAARWTLRAAVVVLLGSAAPVAAAEPSEADIKTARQLFSEAEQLRAHGDCAGAAAKLQAALVIKETPGLRFHLAHCEERLGQLVQANADYHRASELIRGGMSAPDVQALLEPAQKSLSERLPTLRIRIPELTPPARVHLDGRKMSRDDLSHLIPVDPGRHTVVAEADGYDPFRIELSIGEGDDRVVEAKLRSSRAHAPAPIAVAPPPAPADPRQEGQAGAGFGAREAVVIGEAALALTGLGLGIGYSLKYEAAGDEVDSLYAAIDADPGGCGTGAPSSNAGSCARLEDALLDRAHAGNIAIGGFIGAGVFGAAAAATWLLWPARTPKGSALFVVPVPGGAAVSGAF